jgi:hypothetical protein
LERRGFNESRFLNAAAEVAETGNGFSDSIYSLMTLPNHNHVRLPIPFYNNLF